MGDIDQSIPSSSRNSGEFTATHWTIILAAARTDPAHAGAAMEALCRRYWYPVHAYVRRNGHRAEDAEDLAQAFFAFLVEKQAMQAVDTSKGRFRSFLLTAPPAPGQGAALAAPPLPVIRLHAVTTTVLAARTLLSRLQPAVGGGGFELPDYWVWCDAPTRGEDGRYHLFV